MFNAGVLAAARRRTSTYSLPFTNGNAEAGNTTGFTQRIGSTFAASTSGPHAGTYKFVLGTADSACEVVANPSSPFDVPSGAFSMIDAGHASLNFSFWAGHFHDFDNGAGRVEFFDSTGGAGNFLGARTSNLTSTPADSWALSSNDWPIPAGTRSFVVYFFGSRNTGGGTELSYYLDDIQPLVISSVTGHIEKVYACRGSDGSGWTVDTGTGQPTSAAGSQWSWPGLAAGSQVAYSIHKDIAVSSLSAAAQAAIAAGSATLHLHRVAWDTNHGDKSRTRIICRAAGVAVATVQDAAATTQWGNAGSADFLLDGTVAVPNTTDTFRVQLDYTRIDGTVLDARISFLNSWITW